MKNSGNIYQLISFIAFLIVLFFGWGFSFLEEFFSKYGELIVVAFIVIVSIFINSKKSGGGFFSDSSSRMRIRKARDKENLSYLFAL